MGGESRMIARLTLNLESPLLVGKKTLVNSYKESKQFISSDVLRAAYARILLDRCPYGLEPVVVNGQERRFWVQYRDRAECGNCLLASLCRQFSTIRFPALYPKGGSPYPMTARRCKYPTKQCPAVVDMLRIRIKKDMEEHTCPICGSPYESCDGIHVDGYKIAPIPQMITKTAVDIARRTARQARLYSVNVASERMLHKQGNIIEPTYFSGYLEISDPSLMEALKTFKRLRVGAGITKGYGKCAVTVEETDERIPSVKERIEQFNNDLEMPKQWLSIDLLTDAYLDLESFSQKCGASNEDYMCYLEKRIGLPDSFTLRYVYKDYESMRGFDTSCAADYGMLRPARLIVNAGAVFVYECTGNTDTGALTALENNGIGNDTDKGFGQVRICDNFHTLYDVLLKEEFK